jgi:hypothetical protein
MLINDNALLPSCAQYPAASGLQQHLCRAVILGDILSVEADLHATPAKDQVYLTAKRRHSGQVCKMRITEPVAGPVQIENAVGTLPDSSRNALPGDKGQPASAHGV